MFSYERHTHTQRARIYREHHSEKEIVMLQQINVHACERVRVCEFLNWNEAAFFIDLFLS